MGTDGFEFVEYTAPDPEALGKLFETLGFSAVARHRSKKVTLYRQGDVNFIVNAEPQSYAQIFARAHGPSVCAMAFRVADASKAYQRALELGAKPFPGKVGPMELNIPAIEGIGGSLIYLVDRYGPQGSIYDIDFRPVAGVEQKPVGAGLAAVDHLTHNVFTRPHGCLVGFLHQALQFPGDPLLRHRGQAHRAALPRDDQPLRQDPHSHQRVRRRQVADRGISAGLSRRGHPAYRALHQRHLCHGREAGRRRDFLPGFARHLL